jgi:hypothetical protein
MLTYVFRTVYITLAKNIFETKPEDTRNLERATLRCPESDDSGKQKLKRLKQNHTFYREQ